MILLTAQYLRPLNFSRLNFFTLVRGEIPPSKTKDPAHLEKPLTSTTLTIASSANLSNGDGDHEDKRSYTVPLRTTAFGPAHLSIRNATAYVEHLSSSGSNDILVDYWIPGMFLRTGTWTFEIAELEDGTCLFAMSLTQ
ncbi:hypothetical protein BU16DRAFT_278781 [Lophium mytilinum]|uniref:Uncharacterized protein n=1 Tax=Lophium mytilinum TaxID=390894 RepID=A0A6A6R5G2_9PEZI|nr:hypothetical protein BU16DRAFT_278781 [Lophium mytilinum]